MEQSKFGSSPSTSALLASLGLRDFDGVFGNRYIGFGAPLIQRYATTYEGDIIDRVQKEIISIPKTQTIAGWVMRGAVREDDNTLETPQINVPDYDPAPVFNRVFGHFFDPANNMGLTTPEYLRTAPTAPDWALVTGANIPDGAFGSRENNYKITDAREAMWRALTLKTLQNGALADVPLTSSILGFDSVAAQQEAERKAYWAATFRTVGELAASHQRAA